MGVWGTYTSDSFYSGEFPGVVRLRSSSHDALYSGGMDGSRRYLGGLLDVGRGRITWEDNVRWPRRLGRRDWPAAKPGQTTSGSSQTLHPTTHHSSLNPTTLLCLSLFTL